MPSLDQLRPGRRGRIAALTGDGALVQRLMEMGLFEGEEVEGIALAPLGDPSSRFGGVRLCVLERSGSSAGRASMTPRSVTLLARRSPRPTTWTSWWSCRRRPA